MKDERENYEYEGKEVENKALGKLTENRIT